jgi:hypothetical protein
MKPVKKARLGLKLVPKSQSCLQTRENFFEVRELKVARMEGTWPDMDLVSGAIAAVPDYKAAPIDWRQLPV